MNQVSKYLLKFIDTHLKKYKPSRPLSRHSRTLLYSLYQKIETSKKKVISSSPPKKHSINNDSIPRGELYDILDQEIKSKIETSPKTGSQYQYTILNGSQKPKNINVFILFTFSSKDEETRLYKNVQTYMDNCNDLIHAWLLTVADCIPDNCSNELTIYLYLTDLHKLLPETPKTPLSPVHVNTAFTTACSNSTNIHIFRLEEWFKVFIHETCHCFGLDFSHNNGLTQKSEKDIKGLFNIPGVSTIKLFETYCEMWAEIVNILFVIPVSNATHHKKERMIEKIETFLQYEQTHSLFQCAKVLDHYGVKYSELVANTGNTGAYKENTDTFCYYVVKSMIMYDVNGFLDFVGNNGCLFKIVETKEAMDKYINIMRGVYRDPEYIEKIEGLQSFIEKQKKNKNKLEYKTLRMSLFG